MSTWTQQPLPFSIYTDPSGNEYYQPQSIGFLNMIADPRTGQAYRLYDDGSSTPYWGENELVQPVSGSGLSGYPLWSGPQLTNTGRTIMGSSLGQEGSSFLEKLWPAAVLALGGGAVLGGLGAGASASAGATGLASLPAAGTWAQTALPALGASAGSWALPASLAGTAGIGTAATAGGGMFDFLSNIFGGAGDMFSSAGRGISDFFSNVFTGGGSGASEFTPAIANSADPIAAINAAMEATGAGTASEAAAALGFSSTEAFLSAVNPGFVSGLGGFMQNAFGNIGSNFARNPLGSLSNLASTLSNLASTYKGFEGAGDVRAAGQDPLGPSRMNAAAQLNNLINNPNSISSYPGYQAGLEGVLRGSAAAGYQASGNELAALQKYGGQFYNDEVTRLARLAGFDFSPVQLTAGRQQAEEQATNLIARALGNLGFMFRSPFPGAA